MHEILLWRDPKLSGAVLTASLVLLIFVATFSLLALAGSSLLLAMSAIGGFRLYLAILSRFKGQTDDTFK